jgi:hypothetical protein
VQTKLIGVPGSVRRAPSLVVWRCIGSYDGAWRRSSRCNQQQFKEAKQLLANCRPCRFGVTMSNDILRHGLGLRIGIYSNDMNVRKTSKPRKADHAADKANPQASKAIRKALLNADTGHPSCHPHHAKLQSTASVSSASRHNCKKFRGGRRPRNILHLPSRGSLADLTIKSR